MYALLERRTLDGLAANDNDLQQQRFEARYGYGIAALGDRFTMTPEAAVGFSDAGRDYSLGWRLSPEGTGAGSLEFGIEATRRESANDNAAGAGTDHGVAIRITARW